MFISQIDFNIFILLSLFYLSFMSYGSLDDKMNFYTSSELFLFFNEIDNSISYDIKHPSCFGKYLGRRLGYYYKPEETGLP